ncbi:hypothetical protein B0191_12950 [Leptospira interrogans serovar Hardjo]|nr:hypothetical protein B0191_12950 [Leptospira interrogans serovar Hardjo]
MICSSSHNLKKRFAKLNPTFFKKMNRSRTHVFLRKILITNSKIRTCSKYQNETYRLFQVTDSFYFFFPNL